MENKSKESKIKLNELVLDINNPRFAELYTGNNNEEELIKYLLYNEAGIEVAKAIVNANEFYQDRPLWVIEKDGKYLVKDGNRRCAAVKALQLPGKYDVDLPTTTLTELPVLIYKNEADVDERIFQEHANSLFRSWERIAKALEVYRLFKGGNTVNSMKDIDSSPAQLIKLASFYYKAVKIGGDDFKKLLTGGRRGGGRAIIFERLFSPKYTPNCGYHFKSNPSYEISIDESVKFESYILALIECLKDDVNYEIKTDTVDNEKEDFFKRLKVYGFDYFAKKPISSPNTPNTTTSQSNSGTNDSTAVSTPNSGTSPGAQSSSNNRGSTKKTPDMKRKALPPGLKGRVVEYFKIESIACPNSKIAMARVTFECVLKYVVEQTKFNDKTTMNKSGYFQPAYPPNKYANFDLMKTKFTELIKANVDRNSFNSFNLMQLHQSIHNYKVNGIPTDGENISHNLLELIEFMLQDEVDLLNSLDLTKL